MTLSPTKRMKYSGMAGVLLQRLVFHAFLLLPMLVMMNVFPFADGGSLTDITSVMNMRQNASNVTRLNNLDILLDEAGDELGAICHLVSFMPFSIRKNGTVQELESNSSWEFTAAFALAIQHLNAGDGSVIAEVEGLNTRCNIKFTPEIVDSQASASHAVDEMIQILKREKGKEQLPCAFLGPTSSARTVPTSILSGLKGYPQFSHQATSTKLDDKETYPLFGRLIPADDGTAIPLLELLQNQFNVSYFGVIHQNDAYGNRYMTSIRAATKKFPGMTVVSIDVPAWPTMEDYERAVLILQKTKFRYFFAILSNLKYAPLMKVAYDKGIAGTGKHTWIYADAISISTVTSPEYIRESPLHLASLGLSRMAAVGGFENVSSSYDKYLEAYKSLANPQDVEVLQSLQPSYPERMNEVVLSSPKSTSFSILYDTAIALGLAACKASQPPGDYFTAQEHYHAMLDSNFTGTSGMIRLNRETGTRNPKSARFMLTNFVEDKASSTSESGNKVNITSFVSKYYEGGRWIDVEPFIFNDGTSIAPRQVPEAQLNAKYIGTPLRAFGISLSVCILLIAMGWAFWTYKFRKQHVVRASQPSFLQIICFGCFALGASIIPLSIDDEHSSKRGCDIACMAFPWLASCGFCIAFSALFTKTHRINKIFKQPNFKRIKVKPCDMVIPMVALLGVNVLLLSLWTALSPFQWEREVISYDEFGQPTESRGFCTSDHGVYFFSLLAVVDLGALLFAVYEAYVARNLSTEFAESEYIAKALVLIMAVSFLGIPITIIAHDEPSAGFFVITGIIFASCMSLLLFIFIPKELYRRKNPTTKIGTLVRMNMGIPVDGNGISGLTQNDSTSTRNNADRPNWSGNSGLVVVDHRRVQEDLMKKVEELEKKVKELEESKKQSSDIQEAPHPETRVKLLESVNPNYHTSETDQVSDETMTMLSHAEAASIEESKEEIQP